MRAGGAAGAPLQVCGTADDRPGRAITASLAENGTELEVDSRPKIPWPLSQRPEE